MGISFGRELQLFVSFLNGDNEDAIIFCTARAAATGVVVPLSKLGNCHRLQQKAVFGVPPPSFACGGSAAPLRRVGSCPTTRWLDKMEDGRGS